MSLRDETECYNKAERDRRAAAVEASVRSAERLDVVVCEVAAVELVKGQYLGQVALRVKLAPEPIPCATNEQEWTSKHQAPVELSVRADKDLVGAANRFVVGQRIAVAVAPLPQREPWPDRYAIKKQRAGSSGRNDDDENHDENDTPETLLRRSAETSVRRATEIMNHRGVIAPRIAYALLLSSLGSLSAALSDSSRREHVSDLAMDVVSAAVVVCHANLSSRIKSEDIVRSVTAAREKWPRSRCLLEALGEEVGEVGRAAQSFELVLPEGHKKHATPSDFFNECLDVAAVATRIAIDGAAEFA